MTLQRVPNQTLLIDADDTLWENNIYFERAIAGFTEWLHSHAPAHAPEHVRNTLNVCEHATIAARGYGLVSFRISLAECFHRLTQIALTPAYHAHIHALTTHIDEHPIELLPNVAETLSMLAAHHRLLLVTKGDDREQRAKLERSSLAPHFSGVEVLPEKHEAAYRALADHHRCDASSTWMVGNSPKSDINPALAAGLHAVFIPHPHTWQLEREALQPAPAGQTLLTLPNFTALTHYF